MADETTAVEQILPSVIQSPVGEGQVLGPDEASSGVIEFFTGTIELFGSRLSFSVLDLLLNLLLPIVIIVVAAVVIKRIIHAVVERFIPNYKHLAVWDRWISRVRSILLVAAVTLGVSQILGADAAAFLGTINDVLTTPFLSAGNTAISILTLISLVPVVWLSSWLGKVTRKLVDGQLKVTLKMTEVRRITVVKLTGYSVQTLTFLVGLSFIGIDISALTVIFGVLGIGIGFGLQDVIANLFSGLVILMTQPIREGDYVIVQMGNGSLEGTVTAVKLMNTLVTSRFNEDVIVPNKQIISQQVHNVSFQDATVVISTQVQVSYEADVDQALEVLASVGIDCPWKDASFEPRPRLLSFDDSGITLGLFCRIRNVLEKYDARHWINLEIWRRFKASGLSIPFPQRDVRIKEMPKG